MKSRQKLNVRNAVLGILMQGPAHGYRIKKLFAPFIAKDGLNDGQLYPVLTQLEREKLVSKETVHQRKSPSKNIYKITERGREEFVQWLTGPGDEDDPVKYDFYMQYSFLLKCTFFEHLPKRVRTTKLKKQIEMALRKIDEYRLMRQDMSERGLQAYKLKIVDFGIELERLKIRWNEGMLETELNGAGRRKQEVPAWHNAPVSTQAIQPVASRVRPPKRGN